MKREHRSKNRGRHLYGAAKVYGCKFDWSGSCRIDPPIDLSTEVRRAAVSKEAATVDGKQGRWFAERR